MSKYVEFQGLETLEKKLKSLSSINVKAIQKKNLTEMFNRGAYTIRQMAGGTPFRTGELRASRKITDDEFGYVKDYASIVEFGNSKQRGQHYLKKNVEIQTKILISDVDKELKRK